MADAPASMVAPCNCTGTLRLAHLACLVRWCQERGSTRCEICGGGYRPEVLPALEEAVKAAAEAQEVGGGASAKSAVR